MMTNVPSTTGQYAFGRFRLAADASLLLEGDRPIALAPKVLQTLRVLLERAGQVVAKDDLMQAIWQGTFVEDTGLTRNISILRRALGDEGGQCIVTVPRVGYRFAAAVTLVSEASLPEPDDAAPFVGRVEEMRRLREALDRCRLGHGALVGIGGDPGLGKTTLATRFVRTLSSEASIGVGRSSERYGPTEPHLPVLEALDGLVSDPMIARVLVDVAPTWAAHVRLTSRRVVTPSHPGTPERLLRELTQFLADISTRRPVVLLLDDMHWADTATTDVIGHLSPRLGQMRVLVVLVYRDRTLRQAGSPFASLRDELRAKGLLHELTVPLLTREEVAQFVASAGDRHLPVDASERLFAHSEGNPLFMSALFTYVLHTDGARPLAGESAVPDSLRGLIGRMLGHLNATQRHILETAATQGVQFDTRIVASAAGLDVLHVEDVLDGVERVHGLVVRNDEPLADRDSSDSYRFRHVLYQSGLVEELAPSRRAALARRVADALLALRGADPAVAGQIALLLELARAYAPAAEQFARASQYATDLLAFKDAHDLALRGVRCLSRATDLQAGERTRLELRLTFAQVVPLSSWQGYAHPNVEALVNQASTLAAQLQDRQAIARVLGLTLVVRLVRAECTAARDAARDLAVLASASGNPALLVNAHMHAQIACHHLGHFADADVHAREVMRLGPALRPHERFINVFDPCVASLAESSRNAWITGRLAQAAGLADEAVALGADIGNPDSLAFAWLFHAWLHGYRGDWVNCVRSADRGIAIAQHAGTIQTLAWNRCVRGWARAQQGDVADGRRELAEGMALSHSIMGEVALPQFRAMMTEVFMRGGAVDEARACLEEALAASEQQDDAYFLSELHRLAATCGARGPHGLTPRQHAERALAVAREQGAAFFEVRAALTAIAHGTNAGALRRALARIPEPEPWADVQAARARLR
jgi:DNA-binding winged helix-turn-helix (wHTH) protein